MDQIPSLFVVRLLQGEWGSLSGLPLNNQFKPSATKGCYGYIWIQFAFIFLCLRASPLTCCIMVGNGIQVCSQQLSCCLCNVLLLPPSTWGPLTYVLICLKKVFKKYLPIHIDCDTSILCLQISTYTRRPYSGPGCTAEDADFLVSLKQATKI